MTDTPPKSTWTLYKRLVRLILVYKGRLFIAILAGLALGGSSYGLLVSSPNMIIPFDQSKTIEEQAAGNDASSLEELTPEQRHVQELIATAAKYDVDVVDEEGRMTLTFVVMTVLAIPVLLLVRAFSIYLNRYFMRWISSRVVRDIRDGVFQNLESQSLAYFGKSDVGKLMSSCTNDMTVIEYTMASTISDLARAPIEVLAALIFIVSFARENELFGVVAVMFLVVPLCLLPIIVLGRRVKRHTQGALSRVADLVSRMHEIFTGIRIVKAFNMEKKELGRFARMNERYFTSVVKALRAELLMTPSMEALGAILACVFLVFCFAKGVQLFQIIPFVLASVMAYKPVRNLAQVNAHLQKGAAALERIFDIWDADNYLAEHENAKEVKEFKGSIKFDSVNFRYEKAGNAVISGATIDIPKGSVIAVVGETGSGKTTLANLLARFYDPTEGSVSIDGVDLREIKLESLRRLIGIVTQETILFNDTVANNIAYGCDEVVMADIERAAKEANAHDFIMRDPAGYDRVVGEKGFVLSGGEKQRVAIARAILRNPPILILDEATSALDTVTERLVQEAIAHVMQDRTVFAIAHRLSTIKHADQILLLDRGQIVERGTHEELYELGGKYRELCDMQVVGA